METHGHDWRVLAQYDITPDDAMRMVEGDDRRPPSQLAGDEAPAPDDARPFLGLHNLRQDEMMIVCMRCEHPFNREVAVKECPGDPDSYGPDGVPLRDGKPVLPPLGPNIATKGVGRNDPCPCGSGEKFKRCHGR